MIDASLAATWGMPEAFTGRSLALASAWAQEGIQAIAPRLLLSELTNAFYERVVRGEADLSTAIEALHVELSHQLNRANTYDYHYLALSEIRHCPLWTGDERFYNSVKKTFPRVKWIGNYPESHDTHQT